MGAALRAAAHRRLQGPEVRRPGHRVTGDRDQRGRPGRLGHTVVMRSRTTTPGCSRGAAHPPGPRARTGGRIGLAALVGPHRATAWKVLAGPRVRPDAPACRLVFAGGP